jgi:hypothetical protein
MPCSFGLLHRPRSEPWAQPIGPLRVTVTDRQIPLVTAAYGTRVARPARTTRLAPGGGGSRLAQRVRSVFGDHRLVGKPRTRRGSRAPLWVRGPFRCVLTCSETSHLRGPRLLPAGSRSALFLAVSASLVSKP